MSSDATVRAFVALDLHPELRRALASLVEELRPRITRVRWVVPEGIHLTLRFLGDTPPHALRALEPALRQAAANCPITEARVSGLGLFPERGSPRTLWLGIKLSPSVLTLQAACEAAAVQSGFSPERRPFRPHLTLGRWRERVPRPPLPAVDLGPVSLDSLTMLQSELRQEGARYTPLARFPLLG